MLAIKSSLIKSYSYFRDQQVLCLRFANGRTYAYSDVTFTECCQFLDSESKGAHFNLFIRGKKPYIELTSAIKADLQAGARACYNSPLQDRQAV
jgi:hypothetical protein